VASKRRRQSGVLAPLLRRLPRHAASRGVDALRSLGVRGAKAADRDTVVDFDTSNFPPSSRPHQSRSWSSSYWLNGRPLVFDSINSFSFCPFGSR
jgi:hypothetical protein